MIRAVIFDLGGTLLHYHDPETDDQQRHFRRITMVGIRSVFDSIHQTGETPLTYEDIVPVMDKHIGLSYMRLLEELRSGTIEEPVRAGFAELGFSFDEIDWQSLRPMLYQALDNIVSPREGLSKTLEDLHQSFDLGLISNTYWASDVHDRHLEHFGISSFLSKRIYSCDHGHIKPHPKIFEDMQKQLQVAPSEIVYVGDTPSADIVGAKKVGWKAILIKSPYQLEELDDIVPDAIIDELPELKEVIRSL